MKQTDGKGSYTYDVDYLRAYDGDSITVVISKRWDFGFRQYVTKEYEMSARLDGVDTPEMRDKRPEWKAAARLARDKVREWMGRPDIKFVSHSELDKYGRGLGDFIDEFGHKLTEFVLENRLGVPYHGQNKTDIEVEHAVNIEWLKGLGRI